MLKVFIGYDPRQPIAFQVLANSIWRRASRAVSITRLDLRCLPIKRRGLTEFTYSRFLVPWLCNYEGQALFLDSDMLCLGDIAELFNHEALTQDVWVVKNPRLRFEWSSMMFFNNHRCVNLTPEFIESDSNPLALNWGEIGELPPEWNHCVGYDEPNPNAQLIHFTQGIPIWNETKDCEYAAVWKAEAAMVNASVSFDELMGQSVHARHLRTG